MLSSVLFFAGARPSGRFHVQARIAKTLHVASRTLKRRKRRAPGWRYGCASTRKKRGTLLAVGRLVPVTVLEARIQSVTGVQLNTSLLPRTRYA